MFTCLLKRVKLHCDTLSYKFLEAHWKCSLCTDRLTPPDSWCFCSFLSTFHLSCPSNLPLFDKFCFFFQKCLAATPFIWGKKASWLIQAEQKLSSPCFKIPYSNIKNNHPFQIWIDLLIHCVLWENAFVILKHYFKNYPLGLGVISGRVLDQ